MIQIFESEKKDGLENLITAKASIILDCEIKLPLSTFIAKAGTSDQDVFYIESILASSCWNGNDDVFSVVELVKAKDTPVHKKFNYMHNEKDIIGCITKSFLLDKEGKLVSDNLDQDNLPDFLEIGVGAVLYTHWEDKELKDRMAKTIAEISEGKWFVSLEVLFPNFDYAISKGSEQKVIQRAESTAFLSKFLRAYGGQGEYDGWKLGRNLKNMIFSGKGLVINPANKRSLITYTNFNGIKAQANILKEVEMSNVEQKDYDKAVADLGATKQSLESAKAENSTMKTALDSLKAEVDGAKALSNEKSDKIKVLETSLEQANAKLTEVNTTLASLLTEVKNKDRINKLISVGVESAKAEDLVKKFTTASDEMFEEVVSLNKTQEKSPDKKVEDAKASLKGVKLDDKDDVKNSSVDASDKLLEEAKAFFRSEIVKK